MKPAIRVTLGVIIGSLVAAGLTAAFEALGHRVYPIPADLDFTNREKLKSFIATLPTGAFVIVVAGWILATLGGGVAGSLLARHRAVLITRIVGALMLCATIANLVIIPHPMWMAIAAVAGIVLATWLAGRLMQRASSRQSSIAS